MSADSEYAKRIPDAFRLTDAQRSEHPDKDTPPLAHTVCPVNPLGLGYTQPWYLQTSKIQQVEAPPYYRRGQPVHSAAFYRPS